jgi:glycosyltransferase involved in cell wall biosynthesis
MKIKIIFTTHDYFGICPKVNLFDYNKNNCLNYKKGEKCVICNKDAVSSKFLSIYNSKFGKNIKKYVSNHILKSIKKTKKPYKNKAKDYVNLREYYYKIFNLIDNYHFNSTVSKEVFLNYLKGIKGKVLNITTNDIIDNRKKINYRTLFNNKIKFTYMGYINEQKGFYYLMNIFNEIKQYNKNWELNIYADTSNLNTFLYDQVFFKFHGKYNKRDFKRIFNNSSVLIVPSLWKETFGLIALEAFSYGIPSILTNNVGAKDIFIDRVNGIICDEKKLINEIINVLNNPNILFNFNKNILNSNFNLKFKDHIEKIYELYVDDNNK